MMTSNTAIARGSIEPRDWRQEAFAEQAEGPQLGRAQGVDGYHGDIEAEVTWSGLTVIDRNGVGTLVSLQRMVGTIGGRSGAWVVRIDGTFEGAASRGQLTIVRGSGTGELSGISGQGQFGYEGGKESWYTLKYQLEE
jgi:Protein of unknown function (DUF3224)